MVNVNLYKKLHYFDINIKFNVNKEVVVIQGESGAGKTTVLDCIAGIKSPDEGEICIDNKIVFSSKQSINIPIKDRGIGYVFQSYALFPHLTVKENIRFGLENRKIKDFSYSDYITDVLKIKHLESRFPSQLSGGEKQRVALARAVAMKPQLLLLDEPFSALDGRTKKTVYQEFLEFKSLWKIDMILITHNDDEAKLLGDRVLKICDGMLF
jgi:molybdate transport system ATP-binding protein